MTICMRQSPILDSDAFRRRFSSFGKHDVQVGIGLIEKLFEIHVIHQYNPHYCGGVLRIFISFAVCFAIKYLVKLFVLSRALMASFGLRIGP